MKSRMSANGSPLPVRSARRRATVTISVREVAISGYEPPVAPDVAATAGEPFQFQSMSVDGAVLDAVKGVQSLGSISGQIGVDGIVLAAANQVSDLHGITGSLAIGDAAGSSPWTTARIWQLAHVLETHAYGRSISTWDPQGLTGFSLLIGLLGTSDGSARTQIILESLVREGTLIVQISNSVFDASKQVAEYRVMQADGKPLPSWLDRAGPDVLIGRRPADLDFVSLRVTVLFTDGTSESKEVRIETMSGEIKPLALLRSGEAAPLFPAQFAAIEILSDDETRQLAEALER